MDITASLEALAALPKEWRCTSTFSDGKVRIMDQPTQSMAEAHAKGQRRFLGKVVASGGGKDITLDIVEVQYIGSDWAVAAKHIGCTVDELKAS